MKKKFIVIMALALALVMVLSLAGCKKKTAEVKYVAMLNGEKITAGVFYNFLIESLNAAFAAADGSIDFNQDGESLIKDLKDNKMEDGKTYYDYVVESTLEECLIFQTNVILATEAGYWPTDEEIAEYKSTIKSQVESYLSSYGSYYGVTTLDGMAGMMFYKSLSQQQDYYVKYMATYNYNTAEKEKMTPADDVLLAFYNDNVDLYRLVKVRHCLLSIEGKTEQEASAIKAEAEKLAESINSGETSMEEAVTSRSDDPSKTDNKGYMEVCDDGTYVANFTAWAIAQTEVKETVEIVETSYGYHIMECTEIKTYESSEDVKKNVLEGYKNDQILQRCTEKDFELTDIKNDYIETLIEKFLNMDFEEENVDSDPTATSGPTAVPTATPVPQEATTNNIGKIQDEYIWASIFQNFFSEAIGEVDFTVLEFPEDATEVEQFALMVELLNSVDEDDPQGRTHLEVAEEKAINLCQKFIVSYILAKDSDAALTDEKIKELTAECEELADSIMIYMSSYGGGSYASRDEAMLGYTGWNLADYTRFYIADTQVAEYAQSIMDKMEIPEDELLKEYNDNKDKYRVVCVRDILRVTTDSEGKAMSDEDKAKVYAVAQNILKKLENGDDPETVAKGWSQSSTVSSNGGLEDIFLGSRKGDEIEVWAMSQTEIGGLAIIELDDGYHIVQCAGIVEYNETKGTVFDTDTYTSKAIKDAVLNMVQNFKYEEILNEKIGSGEFDITEKNEAEIDKLIEEFLDYSEAETEESESNK